MSNVFSFKGTVPVVAASSFIHPRACLIGDVIVGEHVYIGPGATLRGDFGQIIVANFCNIQDNCVLHTFPGQKLCLEEGAHVGHGAVVHGASIGKNCLIGINAVVLDNAVIGADCIIGALSLVPAESKIPARSLVLGTPERWLKISAKMLAWKEEGTTLYTRLTKDSLDTMKDQAKPRGRGQNPADPKSTENLRNLAAKEEKT